MIYNCTAFLSIDFDVQADSFEEACIEAKETLLDEYGDTVTEHLFVDDKVVI